MPRGATLEEMKRAYRRLARELHPDRNPAPDAEEQFKRIAAAWEALSDPRERVKWQARGEVGPGRVPRTFLEDFTDAVERAELLLFRVLLPRYLDGWRVGLGARVASALAADLVDDRLDEVARGPAASWRGRLRAWRWVRRVDVLIDYGPAWEPIAAEPIFGTRRWRVVFYPLGFWDAGIREAGALDSAVALRFTGVVVGLLARDARYFGPLTGPAGQAAAAAWESEVRRARLGRLAFWALVALVSAAILYAGLAEL